LQGCDRLVLISGPYVERSALPNLGLRLFQVTDDAKTKLEVECPGVISCVDIVAIAMHDAAVLVNMTFMFTFLLYYLVIMQRVLI
jgi:peroxidase